MEKLFIKVSLGRRSREVIFTSRKSPVFRTRRQVTCGMFNSKAFLWKKVRFLTSRVWNFLRIKAQFNFFSPLACCGLTPLLIFGLYSVSRSKAPRSIVIFIYCSNGMTSRLIKFINPWNILANWSSSVFCTCSTCSLITSIWFCFRQLDHRRSIQILKTCKHTRKSSIFPNLHKFWQVCNATPFKWVLNTDRGFKAAAWTLETKMVMYSISLKLNLAFNTIGKATANKITAKLVGKNSRFRFGVNN